MIWKPWAICSCISFEAAFPGKDSRYPWKCLVEGFAEILSWQWKGRLTWCHKKHRGDSQLQRSEAGTTLVCNVNTYLGLGSSTFPTFVFFPFRILLPCLVISSLVPSQLCQCCFSLCVDSFFTTTVWQEECSQCIGEFMEQIDDSSFYTFYRKASRVRCTCNGNWETRVYPL